MMDEFHMWLIGGGVTIAIFTFSVWARSANQINKKMDDLKHCNDKAHGEIYKALGNQTNHLRDKIEELWKHRVKGD